MQVISIFIAGAKNLKEQRLGLKALTNDLNAKYAKKGWDVSLNMNSYENFGEKQSDYNDFILNQANIIIFVLKDRIGQKTEDEYLLATNAYKLNGHPEVITFLHAFEERTPEIDHIEQLVNSATDTYYVDYTNTEDLIAKAKDRINTFVENQINQNCSWLKRIWKKALLFLGGILALVLFLLTFILFDSTNYLVVLTPDPPVSIVNSGMGKDFISQQIVDGVKEIGDSSQYKFDRIVKELFLDSEENETSEEMKKKVVNINSELEDVEIPDISNRWIRYLRRLLGNYDVYASVRIIESDSTFISRVTLETGDRHREVKTIVEKKTKYANNQRCALGVIKKSAAYIAKAYSTIASVLYDYHPQEGLEVYQMNSPWVEDLYSRSEQETMLLENSKTESDEAAYSLLLLADYYEKGSLEKESALMTQKAIGYYRQFLERNQDLQTEIQSKINYLESDKENTGGSQREAVSVPDYLIQQGKIPLESNPKQLVIVSNEDILYDKGNSYYKATLYAYEQKGNSWQEAFPAYKVNLGVKGIASLNQKKEGDLKTPSGFYPIPFVFGYHKDIETKMKFVEVGKSHVWVCDTSSSEYNRLIVDKEGLYTSNPKNEKLYRSDILNKYAIAIGYNMSPVEKGKGSAIFMHVERYPNHKTAGCISMPESKIKELIKWLNPQKNPSIYISKRLDGRN